ncbi:uncharacterized protein LOC141605984 [Silene latifolia]|uniref:uncharacterized protein LOC141605984 n=1 Tax=Silene latifolia TaxID=37657 RepID=UPI003D78833C
MAIWSVKSATKKKFQVKVKVIKLEGFMINKEKCNAKMAVEIKWDGNIYNSGISSLYKKYHQGQCFVSKKMDLKKMVESIEWNDEFDHVCNLFIISKNTNLFASWIVSFNLLYGESDEPTSSSSSSSSKVKMQVIGKGRLNLGELASNNMEASQVEQNIPLSLELNGVANEANLNVLVSLKEMKKTAHSRTMSNGWFENDQNSGNVAKFLRRAKSQGPRTLIHEKDKKSKTLSLFGRQLSWLGKGRESTGYVAESPPTCGTSESNTVGESQLDLVKKGGFWMLKRRKSMKKAVSPAPQPKEVETDRSNNPGTWQMREILSRDGATKLSAEVFFASYDQRSEIAAGESACTAIAAVMAHWLQLNPYIMLSGPEFDRLITEGSSEWRKLCKDETNMNFYPDKRFDLEAILRADLRPLIVRPNDSHFGFFHPEEFDHLKGTKSFDEIWDDINENVNDFESRIYIVRWNDHFFIMKIEGKANYIIDSLGERLYEGCNQAYVLKFDDSTVMYDKEEEGESGKNNKYREICRGKDCCKEYMKRFLAAIPVRELKEQEAKGKTVDMIVLNHRLMIDFHLSTPSSSVSTANTSKEASPNESPLFLTGEDLEV